MNISKKIKKLREQKNYTLTELAAEANISKGYLSRLENDNSVNPSGHILLKLALALDISVENLLNDKVIDKYEVQEKEFNKFYKKTITDLGLQEEDIQILFNRLLQKYPKTVLVISKDTIKSNENKGGKINDN